MTVSTAIRRSLLAAVAVALLGVFPVPADAQSGPVQLLKKRQPDRATPPAPVTRDAEPGTRAPSGVTVRRLGVVSTESVGVLTSGQGGLGSNMWGNLERSRVVALLDALPDQLASPALRDLQQRLLLTAATIPAGEGRSVLELRALKLAALGDLESVEQLVGSAPDRQGNEVLDRLVAEAALMSSDPMTACSNAGYINRQYRSGFWQRLDIYCRIRQQDRNGAMLGLDLLRESSGTAPFLLAAEAALAGADQPKIQADDLDVLDVAMLIAGGYGPPDEAIESIPTSTLLSLAFADTVPTETRLLAAERGVAAGVVEADTLRSIYQFVGFGTAQMSDPIASARNLAPGQARALLYQASQIQSFDAARAELMRAALATAGTAWQYLVVAHAFQPVVSSISPSSSLNWFAPFAVAGLLTAGDYPSAERWVAMMEANGPVSDEAARLARDLRPLIWIAQSPEPALSQVASVFPGNDAGADLSVRARLLPLMAAVGIQTPGESWTPLLSWIAPQAVEMAPEHLIAGLRRAADQQRTAEVAVLALRLLGTAGPGGSARQAVVVAVEALQQIGLEADARAIALESAIAGVGSGS
ncbi:MAG: hypothetical protein RIC36_13540 [Rhodospirillales bacterium]